MPETLVVDGEEGEVALDALAKDSAGEITWAAVHLHAERRPAIYNVRVGQGSPLSDAKSRARAAAT